MVASICSAICGQFQKYTQPCQCEILSKENSETSFGSSDDNDNFSEQSSDDYHAWIKCSYTLS